MDTYTALKQMRELTNNNIPFSLSYITYNSNTKQTNGVKHVSNCILRTGHSIDKGIKSFSVIAYTDLTNNKPKNFYLPLLLTFNNIIIA